MPAYTIYSTTTGEVRRHTTCPEEAIALQPLATDEAYQPGLVDPSNRVTPNGPEPLPPQPSEHHVFDFTQLAWVDTRTLQSVKAAKNEAINRARATANTSTFTFQGKPIAVDALSRGDIDAAHGAILMLQALPPSWPGAWKTADNDYVPIPDVATWGAFYGAMVAAGTANFNHAQALKAQLAAATTMLEVEAVPAW